MENEFVPHSIALALKKLGFNERCLGCYDEKGVFGLTVMSIKKYYTNSKEDTWNCAAPLYQQAFRWFREKYKLDRSITTGIIYSFTIDNKKYEGEDGGNWFNTYKEAEIACLRKLIEIVKQNKNE